MKQLIKAIIPRCVINKSVNFKDQVQLSSIPALTLDPTKLQSANNVSINNWFNDQDIKKCWDDDHSIIAEIYGDDDCYGGVNPGDRRALYYLILALNPKNILEVGTHIGASTIYMACALKQRNQDGEIDSVDIIDVNHPRTGSWKKVGMKESPADFACDIGCRKYIKFHEQPSLKFMSKANKSYDIIFLDGDHRAPAVYREVSAALPLLNEGGVILLHDYYPNALPLYNDNIVIKGPFMAMKRVCKENPMMKVIPLGNLPWPTKQGTNATSLAVIMQVN